MLLLVNPPLSDEYLSRFSEAVVQEIWNEMGRNRISSISELARRAGMTAQYATARLKVDPKTKKPVVVNMRDLAAFGDALDFKPSELLDRAHLAALQPVDEMGARRDRRAEMQQIEDEAARDEDQGGDDD